MGNDKSLPQQINQLIEDLGCKDATTCKNARESLVEIGSPAVPELKKALAAGKDWTRWESAKALGEIGDPEGIPALVEALRDKNFDVRWLAAKGLIAIGWKSAVPVIESLMEHPGSVWMRDGSHHVLHDLAHGPLKDPLQPFLKVLKGIEPAVRIPLEGRRLLEELKPIETRLLREEEEAKQRAEEEAAQTESEAQKQSNLEAELRKELGAE